MGRTTTSLLCLACLLLAGAKADDSQAYPDCALKVQEALQPVQAQLAACKKDVETQLTTCNKKADKCASDYNQLYATWDHQKKDADALQGIVAELKAQLQKAKDAAAKAPKLDDWASLFTAVAARAQASLVAAGEEVKLIVQELQQGKVTRVLDLLGSWAAAFRGAASCTIRFVQVQADKHLPDSVKKQIAAVAAKVQEEWKEHVASAEWAQPVLKQVDAVVAEVQAVVSKALSSTPALAPLADPVTVQLVVYAVFALPVLLLLVLPLALCLGRRSPAKQAAVRPPGRKAKKGPAGKRA